MKQLWAPWRLEYILSPPPEACIFCKKPADNLKNSLVLYRNNLSGVILNKYPYNNGHLLVYPLRHLPNIEDLSQEESASIFELIRESTTILKKAINPEGFNIGANIGKAAGAGVDSHIHFHIIPRWSGDVNFMPLLAEVKAMPEHLQESYRKLSLYFQKIPRT